MLIVRNFLIFVNDFEIVWWWVRRAGKAKLFRPKTTPVNPVKENAGSVVFKYNGSYMAGNRGKTADVPAGGSQEERFLQAFDEFSDALFRHAMFRLSDRERAVDLVHDTFTKVWMYVRDGHEIASYKPFLYKVLNNLIIDEYRKRKEASLDAIFEVEGVDESNFAELMQDDVESLINTLDGKRAMELLKEIPEQYKEVIVLRYVDQLKPKEIAVLVEETENVVSVRIHRGMALLKTMIDELNARPKQT